MIYTNPILHNSLIFLQKPLYYETESKFTTSLRYIHNVTFGKPQKSGPATERGWEGIGRATKLSLKKK